MAPIKSILHLTPFFPPNIGGVETHLHDLTTTLNHLHYSQLVLTYSPLTTNTSYRRFESTSNLTIRRFYLPGHNLFHRLEKHPLLNLAYITPYLFIRSFLYLLFHPRKIDTIHSHGINAALVGLLIQRLFHIPRHVVSIYSTYDNVPLDSQKFLLLAAILNHCDQIITQTDTSVNQLINIGVKKNLLGRYYHWIDTNRFKPIIRQKKHQNLQILFVGRLIPPKNAQSLITACLPLTNVTLTIVGDGPERGRLQQIATNCPRIKFVGDVPYLKLHRLYQQADWLCLPSNYQEGWGRVLAESVSCGTPVICSPFGGTHEAVDPSVAIFTPPTPINLRRTLKQLLASPKKTTSYRNRCRKYALKHFSPKNIRFITQVY